jgi:hypothetical protein
MKEYASMINLIVCRGSYRSRSQQLVHGIKVFAQQEDARVELVPFSG